MARPRGIKAKHPLGSVASFAAVSQLSVVAADSLTSTGVKISELPAASAANDTDQLEVNQSGTSRRVTVGQLAVAIVSGTVNVRAFGALGDDANDDYPAIQAAVDFVKASPGYGTIIIPTGTYRLITGEVVLDADNLHLIISPGATLKQMTYGWSTIQIRNARGCSVTGGGKIINTLDKTVVISAPSYDGQPGRNRFVGIYCMGCSDTVIEDLTMDDMFSCVFLFSSNIFTTYDENNAIRNCLFNRYDFGILGQCQRNFVIDGVIGNVCQNSQNVPPHLIYMTFIDDLQLKSQSVSISDCMEYDNATSSSIKMKHTDGAIISNFTSRKCARGFDINCDNLTMVAPQVSELVDISDTSQGGIVLTECSNVEIVDPCIILPDNNDFLESIVIREDAPDTTIRGGYSSAMRTAANTNGHIRVFGPRAKLIDMMLVDRGVAKHPVTFHSTAVDCALIRPHVKAAAGSLVLKLDAGATNSRLIVNQDQLNFDFSLASSVLDSGTGTRISFEGRLPRATSAALLTTTTYQDAQVIVSDSAAGKNPARNDNRVWYYPDGTTVVSNGEALGWSAALVAAGGTAASAPRLAIIQTFIDAEKASGAWYLTDDYWCLWGENATQGLFSLKQRRFLTIGGSAPVFTADRGYAFDGVDDWINTNFAPATHGVAMTGINLRLAWYERVNVGTTTYVAGVFEGSLRNLRSRPRTSGNINQSDVNCAATTFASGILDSRGYTAISRNDTIYVTNKNGVASAPVVPGSNATVLPSTNIYLGGLNNAGTAGSFRATSLGLACVGASLTAAQETAQYNAVQAWATSIGANV